MTFEAYMNNIRTKTGKEPKDFFDEAVREGVLRPDTKTMEFVAWLKGSAELGHGHAMAVWEASSATAGSPCPKRNPLPEERQAMNWTRRTGVALSALATFSSWSTRPASCSDEPVLQGTRGSAGPSMPWCRWARCCSSGPSCMPYPARRCSARST